MPESFTSCFGEHGRAGAREDIPGSDPKVPQSTVICLYQTKLAGCCRPVSVTWCKSLLGQGFSVSIDDPHIQYVCRVDMRPWLFWKKQGSKSAHVEGKILQVFWDLSSAKYVSGPEPLEGFYVVVLCDHEIVLLLGDMQREAYKKTRSESSLMVVATLLSRKEHIIGKRIYHTKAQFGETGSMHDITIECHVGNVKEPWLCVRVDKQAMVHVQHLMWKFRGNQTILVDGMQIEVLWDAHNWLFNPNCAYAVFTFHSCAESDKPWLRETTGTHSASILERPATHSFKDKDIKQWFTDSSCASMLEWPNTHSFKGFKESHETSLGFSLFLYAWRSE